MKKIITLMLLPILLGLGSCKKLTPEEAVECVMEGSRERMPLLLQQMMDVDNITVDSMHLFVYTEPMSGYLYTTWTAGETSVPIIVEVNDIKLGEDKDYIEWQADWSSAELAFDNKRISME